MSRYRPPKFISKRRLQKSLRHYGCEIHENRGKGSHWVACRELPGGTASYTFPDRRDYGPSYIMPARRQLELTPDDGVSDRDIYEKR